MRVGRLFAVVWKEFRQLRRDPTTMGMLFGIPVVQLLLFGFAVRTDVQDVPIAVYDRAGTGASRALVQSFQNTGSFRVVGHAASAGELRGWIAAGDVRAGLVIPDDYARRLNRGEPAGVQVLVDAADPITSRSVMGTAALLGMRPPPGRIPAGAAGAPVAAGAALDMRILPLFNPGLRNELYIVPGIIGLLLSITMLLMTAVAVVRERERGTLEQLIVTPLTRAEFMLGKAVPYVAIGYVQLTAVLLLGWAVFGVVPRGSLGLLYAVSAAFILANLGLGLMISNRAESQRQAMMMAYFFMLPNILLSGFIFPREAMPAAAQWIGAALPLTYFLEVLRGVILRGTGTEALWREVLVLTAFAAALTTVSVTRFRKRLD
ncbi:MAG TPA: ABC transporter permease [Longimicrobiaceae bacterium]|nr:ABC transporter permease [Longimicrobiaceae bacterium]